jgi:hypothetical protein
MFAIPSAFNVSKTGDSFWRVTFNDLLSAGPAEARRHRLQAFYKQAIGRLR